jgi:16S rRNA (guanine527-N7)-methyltransferase
VTPREFSDKLKVRASLAGCTLDASLLESLHAYYELLSTWNRKINLTAVNLQDLPVDAIDRLFIEPVAAARVTSSGNHVIDIGSGGGSPAIPFALAQRSTSLTMIESRVRKSTFLREAARAVQLHATVITSRFEEAAHRRELQNAFEILTIRAVRLERRTLPELAQFVSSDGRILLFQRSPAATTTTSAGLAPGEFHQLTPTAGLQIFKKR